MKVITVPCLKDNYAYLVVCEETGHAGVVDPGEAEPVLKAVKTAGVQLTAILNTHQHWDHVGGNEELLDRLPRLAVYGHHTDAARIPGLTVPLREDSEVIIGKLRGRITHNPGHTLGAITYYFDENAFTGDTLFGAGCGKLFEGTAEQMYDSLCNRIGGHAPELRIYFGHEYTVSNLRFALHIEPSNPAIQERMARAQTMRAQGLTTTPSTLEEEWATNPYMRWDSPEVQAKALALQPKLPLTPGAILGAIRELKNRF